MRKLIAVALLLTLFSCEKQSVQPLEKNTAQSERRAAFTISQTPVYFTASQGGTDYFTSVAFLSATQTSVTITGNNQSFTIPVTDQASHNQYSASIFCGAYPCTSIANYGGQMYGLPPSASLYKGMTYTATSGGNSYQFTVN